MSGVAEGNSENQKRWKTLGKEVAVKIVSSDEKVAHGLVYIQEWTHPQRVKRSIQWGLIFLGIALFCVFIPILHFVLVPLFLLVAPVAAYSTYTREKVVLGGTGHCPKCLEVLPIEKSSVDWPIRDLCTRCQTAVQIFPADK